MIVQLITDLAAELIAFQATPVAQLDAGVTALLTKEMPPRLVVWNTHTKRLAVVPWDAVRALVENAGLSHPNPEQRH